MVNIFVSLLIGFVIGYKKFISDGLIRLNSKFQTLCLLLLIFTMGVGIGGNSEILSNIHIIGLKSLLFALASIAGSVCVVYIVSRFLETKEAKK